MPLTDVEIQNIIFNETRSLSGPGIDTARVNIAHAIINGDEKPPRPATAPTTAQVPPAEQGIYSACASAVATARAARHGGNDPTSGARHFNFRASNSKGPWKGYPLRTQVGPLNNSYPTSDLPATGVYANTYE